MTQYDVVFFTGEHHQKANALIKHLPPEELARRNMNLGVHVKTEMPIPKDDGTRSGLIGNVYVTRHYGAMAFCNRIDAIDKETRAPIPLTGVMLQQLEPGLVVGNFKPETFERPEYVDAKRQELAAEDDARKKRELRKQQREQEKQEKQFAFEKAWLVYVADLAGIKKPERLPVTRLENIARGVALCGEPEICDREEWLQSFGVNSEDDAVETCPPEIANDPLSRAALVRAPKAPPK